MRPSACSRASVVLLMTVALTGSWGHANAFSYSVTQTLTPPAPVSGIWYGFSTAVLAGKLAVGSPVAGRVYVYDLSTGALVHTLQSPAASGANDLFGYSLAVASPAFTLVTAPLPYHLLVGAPYSDQGGTVDAGAAYLFNPNTGALVRTFLNPTPASGERFGIAVAAVGGNVLIGADGADDAGVDAGAAYLFNQGFVFFQTNNPPELLRTFTKPAPVGTSLFGAAVSGVGGEILIGDPADNFGGPGRGAAFLFNHDGLLLHTFRSPTPFDNANFGAAVTQLANDVVIGAPAHGAQETAAGAAYQFDTAGTLRRTYQAPAPQLGDWFGYSIGVSSTDLLIGAPKYNSGSTVDVGAAHLFDAYVDSPTFGSLVASLQNPTPAQNDAFGFAVAGGCNLLAGAPGDSTAGGSAGATYLFAPIAPSTTFGAWSPVKSWPTVATHSSLQPDGKVLFWRGQGENTTTHLWDPVTDTLTGPFTASTDFFCGGHASLADGRTIAIGGSVGFAFDYNAAINIFDSSTSTWSCTPAGGCALSPMTQKRWYATATLLPDGKLLATGGNTISPPGDPTSHEVYDPTANTWTLLGNAHLQVPTYSFMFVLPSGKVFQSGPTTSTRLLDATSTNLQEWSWDPTDLPSMIKGGSAILYDRAKIMKAGGENQSAQENPATNKVEVIDMDPPSPETPAWSLKASMAYARANHTLVVLPDGRALAVGGSAAGGEGAGASVGILHPERWTPPDEPMSTGSWTTMACMAEPRMYHSTALLLPDGRVLAAGGDHVPTAEVYSPPYVFATNRPAITADPPAEVFYQQVFTVQTDQSSAIDKVAFIRPGSVTHGFDQNQRYVPLEFTENPSAGNIQVTAPPDSREAPPGTYMLFLVNDDGTPSQARLVKLRGCG